MYAQVFEVVGAEPGKCLNRSISCELLPALRTERGFSGALSLIRRETGELLLLVLWETEDEAARPLPPCFAALTSAGFEVWEVGARA